MSIKSKQKTLEFLSAGTQVLAAVKPDNELPPLLAKHLIRDVKFLRSGNYYTSFSGQFAPIFLQENLTITFSVSSAGRVQKKLDKCKCTSPALNGEVFQSLNHALEQVSQVYEPKRTSHGGKVYDYVLFEDTSAKVSRFSDSGAVSR
jgi:hypothetical protein